MSKNRLDQYLLQNEICVSREKAKNLILAGCVSVNGQVVLKPSFLISENDTISLLQASQRFVSRGGEKLQRALEFFDINISNRIVLDLGSSTGGFVDCLLKNGARKVYAVDVGYGQLDYSLRMNANVVVMERHNARNLTRDDFSDSIDFITADLSFISIAKVMKNIVTIFDSTIDTVLLVKPQFEAESYQHKKGVVKKPEYHYDIVYKVIYDLSLLDIQIKGLTYSPIKGPKGNIEFLLLCTIHPDTDTKIKDIQLLIKNCVDEAHKILD